MKHLDIRQTPADCASALQTSLDGGLCGHPFAVVTKYYTAGIQFVRHDGALDALPESVQAAVEGMLIYFDAENVSKCNNWDVGQTI